MHKIVSNDGSIVAFDTIEVDGKHVHHGQCKVYKNDKLVVEYMYVHGKKQGLSVKYDVDGNVVYRCQYVDDRVCDKAVWYNKNGSMQAEGTYVDDKLHGLYKQHGSSVEVYFDNGERVKDVVVEQGVVTKMIVDGNVTEHYTYVDDKLQGPYKKYIDKKLCVTGYYYDNKKNAKWTHYDESSIVVKECFMLDDYQHGPCKTDVNHFYLSLNGAEFDISNDQQAIDRVAQTHPYMSYSRIDKSIIEWRYLTRPNLSRYMVSDQGQLKNIRKGVALDGSMSATGYVMGRVTYDDKTTKNERGIAIHTFVLESFVGFKPDGCSVDHIDRCRTNNKLCNLRWATRSDQNYNRDMPTIYNYAQADDHTREWKQVPIEGLEGVYVSVDGYVKYKTGNVTSGYMRSDGYHIIHVDNDKVGKQVIYLIHRLVALTYHGVSETDAQDKIVNHKDGNKSNNHIDNLEIITQQANIQHAYDNKLINKVTPRNGKQVCQIDQDGNVVAVYPNANVAGKNNGLRSGSDISACCRLQSPAFQGEKTKRVMVAIGDTKYYWSLLSDVLDGIKLRTTTTSDDRTLIVNVIKEKLAVIS